MDRIGIVNLALARIGESPIQSLTEGSNAANSAQMFYDNVRKTVLQSFPWSFAGRTAHLARTLDAPPDYRYSYSLPADCLQPIRIQCGTAPDGSREGDAKAFVVRGRSLLTNAEDVYLEYVADVTDENSFDPQFQSALVTLLAAELAMPVGAKAELAMRYRQEFQETVTHAAARSASQFYEELPDNPYLDARW